MRPGGLLRYAMRALTERKLRAVLTILGIVIGPATIVSLVGATQGYSNASAAQFSSLGATTLYVQPAGRSTTLTATDADLIQNMAGVSAAIGYQEANGQVTDGSYSYSASVVAVDFSQLSVAFPNLRLGQGSSPASTDDVGAAVGYSIANPGLQGAANFSVDQVITVSGLGRSQTFSFGGNAIGFSIFSQAQSNAASSKKSFVIRGVYDQFGQGFNISPDTTIFIPLAAGEQILKSSTYTGILVVASSASAVSEVTNELTAQYGTTIRTTSVASLLSTIQSVTSGATTLLEAVAGTSVLVAFIGIMTTMLTSVLERTKEIGVLKALGSSSRGIMMVFLAEAVVTGLIGGLVGVGAGYLLSFLVIGALSGTLRFPGLGGGAPTGRAALSGAASAAGKGGPVGPTFSPAASTSSTLAITPAITPEVIVLAILLAVAVGTFGGLIPAWRASRLNPVEALRRS